MNGEDLELIPQSIVVQNQEQERRHILPYNHIIF